MFFHFLKICPIFFFNSSLWALTQGGAWFPCPVFRLGKQSLFSNYDVQSHVIIKILSLLSGWGSPSSSSGCRGRRTAVGKWGGLFPPITAFPLLLSACDSGVWPQAWSWGTRVGAEESSLKCQFSSVGFAAWQVLSLLQPVNSSLEKEMATHSSILAWRIPWTEEAGGW